MKNRSQGGWKSIKPVAESILSSILLVILQGFVGERKRDGERESSLCSIKGSSFKNLSITFSRSSIESSLPSQVLTDSSLHHMQKFRYNFG